MKSFVLLLLAVLGPFLKLHSQNMLGVGAFLFGVVGRRDIEVMQDGPGDSGGKGAGEVEATLCFLPAFPARRR